MSLSALFLSSSHLSFKESFLQKLFIVSDVSVTDEGSMGTTSPAWVYSGSVDIESEWFFVL